MKKTLGALLIGFLLAFGGTSASAGTPDDSLVQAWRIDDMITLDPAEMFEISTYELIGNTYDTLVELNLKDTNTVLPKLATSWSVDMPSKTFTFKLRNDVKFHSGNAMTARDVVYSFARLAVLNKGPAFLIQDLGISADNWKNTLKAVDDHTFTMTLNDDYAPSYVLNVLTAGNFVVADSKLLKSKEKDGDWGNAWLKTNDAGSGPFKLRTWKPDEILMADANGGYWGGAPKLKRLIWRHVPEESAQRLLLEAGDVDVARNLSADLLDALRAKGGYEYTKASQSTQLYVGMNVKHPQLSKPKVREAIRYLIDYDGLASTVVREIWEVNQTFLPNSFLGYTDSNPYKLDVAKAKQLLAEAGESGGFEVVAAVASTRQDRMDVAQSMQATLAKAGITLKIDGTDAKAALTTYRARKHGFYIGTWGVDYFDPNTNMVFVVNRDNSDKPKGKPLAWRNAWQHKPFNARADALAKETDGAKRAAGYAQLIKDWQPISAFAMMFQEVIVAAHKPGIKNFVIGPSADTTFYHLTSK